MTFMSLFFLIRNTDLVKLVLIGSSDSILKLVLFKLENKFLRKCAAVCLDLFSFDIFKEFQLQIKNEFITRGPRLKSLQSFTSCLYIKSCAISIYYHLYIHFPWWFKSILRTEAIMMRYLHMFWKKKETNKIVILNFLMSCNNYINVNIFRSN